MVKKGEYTQKIKLKKPCERSLVLCKFKSKVSNKLTRPNCSTIVQLSCLIEWMCVGELPRHNTTTPLTEFVPCMWLPRGAARIHASIHPFMWSVCESVNRARME